MTIQRDIPLLENILAEYSNTIGSQYNPYKNHVYRVVNFCFAFRDCDKIEAEKIIIAGCFHDLGMWPGDLVDYLAPSITLVQNYLKQNNQSEWCEEISLMIDLHHKFTPVKNCEFPLVEVFRKGDWVDASLGFRSFGLPRDFIQKVQETFPNLGFHQNLLRLAKEEFFRHPLNPLPIMKW